MQTQCLSVRKASEFVQEKLQNKQRNMVGPKAHGVMKCGEFEPLRTTLDSSPRRDENDNEVLVTVHNLNPYLTSVNNVQNVNQSSFSNTKC